LLLGGTRRGEESSRKVQGC